MESVYVIKNFLFILRDNQKLYEKKDSIFKPFFNFFCKISSIYLKKKGPDSKIIIYDDKETINALNDKMKNSQIDIENDSKNDTKESTKDIIVEIHNVDSHKFIVKKALFNIGKKKGRKRKSSPSRNRVHTKYSRDNILRKIKVKFMHVLIKYINKIISTKYKSIIKKLLPLEGGIAQNNTIDYNKILLSLKLKDIFINFKISQKFKTYEASYNKNVFEAIYEKNIL